MKTRNFDLKHKTSSIFVIMVLFVLSVSISAADTIRIMPLGDSITRGWYGSTSRWGYRKPLYDSLLGAGFIFDFVGQNADGSFADPNHEGHDGWRADEILNGRTSDPGAGKLADWLTAQHPDVVLLHIGTNDILGGNQDANEVNSILDVIDDYEVNNSTTVTVFLALIINRRTYNAATTAFNNSVKDMALNRIASGDDIVIVNMENALDYSTDMYDDVHPNDSGYTKMGMVWYNALVDSSIGQVEEVSQRLELRTHGYAQNCSAFYTANGWRLDIAGDFAVRIDYHYSYVSIAEGWVGMSIGDDANYVLISAGSDGGQSYFYYDAVVGGDEISEQEPRTSNDGTFYISYVAATKTFYLSNTGFGIENAYVWNAPDPTNGQWARPVYVSIGGGSSGAALRPAEAYVDNFEVVNGGLIDWPPATDLDDNGYIEVSDLAVMCESWLEDGDGDIDKNGTVNLFDLAELGLAW
jgi:lysophospholipase L1-like esterase